MTPEDVNEAVKEARAREAAGYQCSWSIRCIILLADENDKLKQELALHKLTETSQELGGYRSQCALCWGAARKENVCDACRDSMEGARE
jgi:hypothetical protein